MKSLSEAAEKKLSDIISKYPDKRSAVMPALYIAQEELGSISDDAIEWVSQRIGMAPVHVREVATFYTMYYKAPVGKYHVQVCRTVSCAIRGARPLSELLRDRMKVAPKTITKDGFWSYEEVECLGSCGTGPMCQINDRFFENLTPEILNQLLDRIEKEKPNLKLSVINESLGNGLKDIPPSQLKVSSLGTEK